VRRTLAVSLAVFLPLGCSGSGSKPDAAKSKAAPPPEPPAAADADTDADEAEAPERDASPPVRVGPEADGDKVSEAAIVYDPKGLYLLSVEDGSQYVPFSGFVHACLAHPAADTIWLVGTPEGATDTRLWALDLRRDANAFALAENVPPQIHAIAVDTWKGGTVRSAMESEFTVGLMVDLRSVPVTRRWIGCSSEMLDCYDDPAAETLREPLAKLANAADAVRLTDAGVAKRLGDRAEKPSRPVLPPTTAKLEVPSEACREEPNDCGRTRGIAGTGLQLVVTANERGDLFHEMLQLYDPATKVFMPLEDPTKTSEQPHDKGTEIDRLYVAGSGRAYAYGDRVVHLDRGTLSQARDVCGFSTDGAVLTGVTK
jgi:hypothetical protein